MKIKQLMLLILVLTSNIFCSAQTENEKKEQIKLDELHKETYQKRDSLSKLYKKYFDEIKTNQNELVKQNLEVKIEELDKLTELNNSKELNNEFDFVSQNPNSYNSLKLLREKIKRRESMKLYETFEKLYNKLNVEIQKSEKGIEFKTELDNFRNSKIGSYAPEFIVKDLNNNLLSLSSFKNNKYVLIDFWASWCGPCREDFGFLKEIYSKYNQKGFEIISVSRDENTELWRKAIIKDKVELWQHFSTKENNSNIESLYFVSAIPQKILIDKNGMIIGRWKGGGKENKTEMEKILNEIFSN